MYFMKINLMISLSLTQCDIFVLNKFDSMCYSGKLNEKSEPLSLGLSWVDGKEMYPVYFNLDLWEEATGKDIKLIKGR